MIVADAGPIIALARGGLLEILPILLGKVVLPRAVFREITLVPDRPGAAEVRAAAWVAVEAVAADTARLSLSRNLGAGEREAIQLAYARGAVLLLDERGARREAERLGIHLTGTLALLEEAKRRHLLPSITEALDRLQASGFHLSRSLRAVVLRRAGEGLRAGLFRRGRCILSLVRTRSRARACRGNELSCGWFRPSRKDIGNGYGNDSAADFRLGMLVRRGGGRCASAGA